MDKLSKKGQEEIAGFMIIVVIISIILLFFLVFYLQSDKQTDESYEVASFLQSALSYTTNCEKGNDFLAMDELIVSCYREENCENEEYSCEVLNKTLREIGDSSWPVDSEGKTKGYKIEITAGEVDMVSILKGNTTNTYKGSQQILPVTEVSIKVSFTAYS